LSQFRGEKTDAARFIAEAVGRGAIAVISDSHPPMKNVPAWIQVAGARSGI